MPRPTQPVRNSPKGSDPLRSRPPLERMLQLHRQIQAGRFPNCRKLAEELEVSAKTIQRDIDFMRDRLGLPIEYDQLHFGFIYTEPVTHFPSVEVSEGEIVALFVAQKALEQYRGTPFEKPLRTAFEKISSGLRDQIGFQWNEVDSSISFRGIGTSVADLELFDTVSRAVMESTELELDYKKLGGTRHESRRVQPYHLGCVENQWYLFAFDLARKQLRTFALPRMRNVRDTREPFLRPPDFSINSHLSGSFGVFTGTGSHNICVRFDAFAAQLIAERQWHPSQKIEWLGDGSLELKMTIATLEEITRWILSWGTHATVVAPAELKKALADTARELASRYA